MSNSSFSGAALLTVAVMMGGLSSAACNRGGDETAPVAEVQTETPVQHLERPVAVQGCLRAGEAANSFVLTSSQAEQDGRTVTYALNYAAETPPTDLREHIGRQVHVEGVVRAQQAVKSYTPAAPAANEPVGTGGEPMVQTTTALVVQQLEVTSMRPLGAACGDR